MGAYSDLFRQILEPTPALIAPADESLIIVSLHTPDLDALCRNLPNARHFYLILDHAPSPLPVAPDGTARVHPLRWDPAQPPAAPTGFHAEDAQHLRQAARSGARTALFLHSFDSASGRLIRALSQFGIRRVAFEEWGRWRITSARSALARKALGRLLPHRIRRLMHRPRPRAHNPLRLVSDLITSDALPPVATTAQGVVLYIGSLQAGGAERQLANLALSLHHSDGQSVRVLTTHPLEGPQAHYAPRLREAGVPLHHAGKLDSLPSASHDRISAFATSNPAALRALEAVTPAIQTSVLDLAGELILDTPRVLHAWLDEPNIIAGIAGILTGVPRIVLSARNFNPTNFPGLFQPWMRPWYQLLLQSPRVLLTANSLAGADDYARWIGVDPANVPFIPNGLDPADIRPPADAARAAFRQSLGLRPDQPLIAGVFRLAVEKQPDVFVDVIDRLRRDFPALHAVIAGVGPLESAVRHDIARRGLTRNITLLGRRDDISTIIAAADLVLLTSFREGTPNCVLEAFALNKPVVATAGGGTTELVQQDRTGLVAPVGNAAALAAQAARLLRDPAMARRLSDAAALHVARHHSIDALRSAALAAYGIALSPP